MPYQKSTLFSLALIFCGAGFVEAAPGLALLSAIPGAIVMALIGWESRS